MDPTSDMKSLLRLFFTQNTSETRYFALLYLHNLEKSIMEGYAFPDPQIIYQELRNTLQGK